MHLAKGSLKVKDALRIGQVDVLETINMWLLNPALSRVLRSGKKKNPDKAPAFQVLPV